MDGSNSGRPRHFAGNSAMFGSDRQQYNSMGSTSAPQGAGNTSPPIPWNLVNFYSSSEGPWHPGNIIPTMPTDTQGRKIPESVGFPANAPSFHGYRNRHLPSECDTLPEDSGYGGSGAPYSIENTSVYEEDRNPETQVTAHRIESLHLHADTSSEAQLSTWSQPHRPTSVATAPASGDHRHYCQDCSRWFRTKSEYNKHMLRHRKPFICDVLDCQRRLEGFSTKNDLDRHKRSVHSDLSVSGPRFVCPLGACATKDPPKLWPRADNFRSHLSRIHRKKLSAEDDLEAYVCRQSPNEGPLRQDLEGVGTAVSYLNADPRSLHIPRSAAMQFPPSFSGAQSLNDGSGRGLPEMQESLNSLLRNPATTPSETEASILAPVQEDDEDFIQPDILSRTGQRVPQAARSLEGNFLSLPVSRYHSDDASQDGMIGDDSPLIDEGDIQHPELPSAQVEHRESQYDSLEAHATQSPMRDTSSHEADNTNTEMADVDQSQAQSTSSPSTDSLSESLPKLDEDPQKLIEFLKSLPKEYLQKVLKSENGDSQGEPSSQESSTGKNQHACSDCSKSFNRPCELKKHKKRHERPYGCTFLNCPKTFGSKNDWKRHESSQHWQLETWQCEDMRSDQQKPCKKAFQRRESFKNHLQRDHMVSDAKQIEEKLEKCRIGRHCDPRFWCGFCEDIIEIGAERVNAWTKRCNHIDDHFSGRIDGKKRDISEWKHPDDSDEKRDGSQQKTKSSTTPVNSNGASDLKRKPSGDAGQKVHKRQRGVLNYMWKCCNCNHLGFVSTSVSCVECEHQRCELYCAVEVHTSHETDAANSG
ncbi:Fc.00g098490.m01.CDS01 [Cosmosporella sp. VM-42]